MANEDKFSKTIDDEQLDEVAGGTKAEIQKDIKFLNAIGAKLDKNATPDQVIDAWEKMGVVGYINDEKSSENDYYKYDKNAALWLGEALTRQDAMIEAMRHTKTFVDLDQYL